MNRHTDAFKQHLGVNSTRYYSYIIIYIKYT